MGISVLHLRKGFCCFRKAKDSLESVVVVYPSHFTELKEASIWGRWLPGFPAPPRAPSTETETAAPPTPHPWQRPSFQCLSGEPSSCQSRSKTTATWQSAMQFKPVSSTVSGTQGDEQDRKTGHLFQRRGLAQRGQAPCSWSHSLGQWSWALVSSLLIHGAAF